MHCPSASHGTILVQFSEPRTSRIGLERVKGARKSDCPIALANASRIRERGLAILAEHGGVKLGGRGEARDRPPLARRHPQEERALEVRQRELPADRDGAEGDRLGQRG